MKQSEIKSVLMASAVAITIAVMPSCKPKNVSTATSGDAAQKAYVAPGKYDEFYALSLIIKVVAMQRITDTYGPIVYSKFGTTIGNPNFIASIIGFPKVSEFEGNIKICDVL